MASPDRFLLAAVMGWPISQSRSPMLHNFWFAQHGLAGSYVPLAIPPERLEAALESRGLRLVEASRRYPRTFTVEYWLSKGAKPTNTMHAMIKKARRAGAAKPESPAAS